MALGEESNEICVLSKTMNCLFYFIFLMFCIETLFVTFAAGFVYGAREGKRLQLFIDDLNLPTPDEFGVQRCNEVSASI